MIEMIEQAVKLHDKYQFERKLDYELHPDKKTHYQISTYIFIPKTLGIDERHYSKADFYRDVQNYIRLKTPNLILRDFTTNSSSPLITINKIVSQENWAITPNCNERLTTAFKFLSAMLKSSIRDHINLIQKRITEAPPKAKIHLIIHNLVEEFLVETEKIANAYRATFTVFNLPNVEGQTFEAYKLADESISLLIEESAVEMFQIVAEYIKSDDKIAFQEALSNRAIAETKYRKSRGYRSVLKNKSMNEEFIFRVSELKKHASSVLFLSTDVHREGVGLEQLLFAVAAGLSMIFATITAFYFQQKYGNFTFSFFVALVVGYMFKDRIKELIRSLFSKYLQNILFDRRIIIRTLDDKHRLGILREKVSFVRETDIPKKILSVRNRDRFDVASLDGRTEYVIQYSKDITLFTKTFKSAFADILGITAINDIMRYNIAAYLKKMGEPIQNRPYLKDGQLDTALCHKVYHLHLVSKYTTVSSQKEKSYKHTRLVLDQEGIKRVEHIPV